MVLAMVVRWWMWVEVRCLSFEVVSRIQFSMIARWARMQIGGWGYWCPPFNLFTYVSS